MWQVNTLCVTVESHRPLPGNAATEEFLACSWPWTLNQWRITLKEDNGLFVPTKVSKISAPEIERWLINSIESFLGGLKGKRQSKRETKEVQDREAELCVWWWSEWEDQWRWLLGKWQGNQSLEMRLGYSFVLSINIYWVATLCQAFCWMLLIPKNQITLDCIKLRWCLVFPYIV